MKHLLFCLFLGLLGCHQSTQRITAPTSAAPATLSGPPARLSMPSLKDEETPYGIAPLWGHAYPLGWSRGGIFAYAYEPADEACGCYFFHLIIQDMVNDKILWDYEYNSDESQAQQPGQLTSLTEMWQAHGEEFEAKLASFGIVRAQSAPIELPRQGSEPLSAVLQTNAVPKDQSDMGFSYLSSYELQMISAKGQKTILKSGELTPGLQEVSSVGYVQSPFEPRVAVLIQEQWRGWEGPPHVMQLRFAGCDLERGWH